MPPPPIVTLSQTVGNRALGYRDPRHTVEPARFSPLDIPKMVTGITIGTRFGRDTGVHDKDIFDKEVLYGNIRALDPGLPG